MPDVQPGEPRPETRVTQRVRGDLEEAAGGFDVADDAVQPAEERVDAVFAGRETLHRGLQGRVRIMDQRVEQDLDEPGLAPEVALDGGLALL